MLPDQSFHRPVRFEEGQSHHSAQKRSPDIYKSSLAFLTGSVLFCCITSQVFKTPKHPRAGLRKEAGAMDDTLSKTAAVSVLADGLAVSHYVESLEAGHWLLTEGVFCRDRWPRHYT